jgi:hypothetical protein
MTSTLYILRQQPDVISPALFQQGEADTEAVFIEQALTMPSSVMDGSIVSEKEVVGVVGSIPTITYDDLVMKIFSFDRTIVL